MPRRSPSRRKSGEKVKPRLSFPPVVRVQAAAIPAAAVARPNYTIPEWIVWGVMEAAGRLMKPRFVRTGIPVTDELDLFVAAPSWAVDIVPGYMGPNHPVYPGGRWSPVVLVEPARHDESKGWISSRAPRLVIPE